MTFFFLNAYGSNEQKNYSRKQRCIKSGQALTHSITDSKYHSKICTVGKATLDFLEEGQPGLEEVHLVHCYVLTHGHIEGPESVAVQRNYRKSSAGAQ